MTFFEQLKKHLSVKQHVLVHREDGGYCIFSHFKNNKNDYRQSSWRSTEEYAINYIGENCIYSREDINDKSEAEKWKIIKAFDIPTGRFQVGDKVIVSEDAKELCEKYGFKWDENLGLEKEKNNMIGQVCEIKDINDSIYYLSSLDNLFSFGFPHEALSYPIETEESTAAQEALKFLQEQSRFRLMTMELAFELLEKNGYVISKK